MSIGDGANTVQASRTTLQIMEALKHLDGAGVTELARHLSIPKSTVHNHLQTLEECEFVTKEGDVYQVGLRFLDFGMFVWDRVRIVREAESEVDRLAETTGELSHITVTEHNIGVYVYQVKVSGAVNTDIHTGKRVPLHQTASGKAILAFSPRRTIDTVVEERGLDGRTPNTITSRDALEEELDLIRDRGYAYDNEEWLRGLRCVAAPIRDMEDRAIGAISVCGPVSRMRGERYESEIPEQLLSTANVVELNIDNPNYPLSADGVSPSSLGTKK